MRHVLSVTLPAFALLIIVILVAATSASAAAAIITSGLPHHRFSQVWLCQSRCGMTYEDSKEQIRAIHKHHPAITHISFEMFNLVADAGVQSWAHNLTQHVLDHNMIPVAMLTAVNQEWINEAHKQRHTLAHRLVQAVKGIGAAGIDFDFEPSSTGSTAEDGVRYAELLSVVSNKLAEHNLTTSADVAGWNANFWQYSKIAATSLPLPTLMSTYTNNFAAFKNDLMAGVKAFGRDRVVVGFDVRLQASMPHELFAVLREMRICRVAFWQARSPSGLPDNWWPVLDDWMKECNSSAPLPPPPPPPPTSVPVDGQCYEMVPDLCPGPATCMCTVGDKCGSYSNNNATRAAQLHKKKTAVGGCAGWCKSVVTDQCPGGADCRKVVGNC